MAHEYQKHRQDLAGRARAHDVVSKAGYSRGGTVERPLMTKSSVDAPMGQEPKYNQADPFESVSAQKARQESDSFSPERGALQKDH